MSEAKVMQSLLTGALSGGTESVEFLNEIMAALQPYLRVAVSKMVKDMVEPMFKETLPGPLKSLYFKKVDLGATPMRFSAVDVHKVVGGSLKFDMDVDWDGDMDIELDADYIPGFGVQHVKLKGRMSCLLRPLMDRLPLVSAIQVSLINPPDLELDFTGAAQALDLVVIDDAIRGIISDVVASICVLPNRLLVKMDPLNDMYQSYLDPMGLVRVTIESATGLQTTGRLIKDVPDAYCIVQFGANKPWKTTTISNSETPIWNEHHDFVLSDRDQLISIELCDSDFGRDAKLGTARISVGELFNAGLTSVLQIKPKGKKGDQTDCSANVTVSCKVFDFVSDSTSILAPAVPGDDNLNNGMLTILVAGAKGLKGSREDLVTQVIVDFQDEQFMTPIVMDMPGIDVNNPCYDSPYRVPLTPEIVEAAPDVKLTFKNKHKPIGVYTVSFESLLNAPNLAVESEFIVEGGGVLRVKTYLLGIAEHGK